MSCATVQQILGDSTQEIALGTGKRKIEEAIVSFLQFFLQLYD